MAEKFHDKGKSEIIRGGNFRQFFCLLPKYSSGLNAPPGKTAFTVINGDVRFFRLGAHAHVPDYIYKARNIWELAGLYYRAFGFVSLYVFAALYRLKMRAWRGV